MNKNPLISIIIPTYNRLNPIKKCIESIKAQEYKNYEIIVVDDASTENIEDIKNYCDIYIKNIINFGPSYSRNIGVLNSKGDILLFIDSDSELLSNSLKKLPEIFMSDSSIGAAGGSGPPTDSGKDVKFVITKLNSSFGKDKKVLYYPHKEKTPYRLYDCDVLEGAFLAVRRDVFGKIGGFDPYWHYGGEDRDFCFRIKDSGYRIVVALDARVIHHRILEGNLVKKMKDSERFMGGKYLQVAIKRDGILGGIKWMIINFILILKPADFFYFIKQFKNFKELHKRKRTSYFSIIQMEEFNSETTLEYLRNKVSLPLPKTLPLPTPSSIVLFVTSRCNALCGHCFLPYQQNKQEFDFNKENIFKIFEFLNRSTKVSLTGGEPFLKNDLELILDYLMRLPLINSISISSNGSFPDKLESICKKIVISHKNPLHIQLSLDGLSNTHNEIRKIPNGFDKVIESCERLNIIKRKYPNISYVVAITIMKQNISMIEELVDYLQKKEIPNKLSIVRGNSFSTFCVPEKILNKEYNPRIDTAVDIDEISQLIKKISEKHPKYFSNFQKQKLNIMLDTLRFKKRQIPCYAGYADAVIYNNGDISICEQIKPFGNLSKWNWDILKAWNSKEAMEHRIKSISCSCIHGCNITTSISMQMKPWIYKIYEKLRYQLVKK